MQNWTPTSWRGKPVAQQPEYQPPSAVDSVVERLAKFPPLVTPWEVEQLKFLLGEAAAGKRFLLQGGDCAERFEDCEAEAITKKIKILLQMSLVLVHGIQKPVVRIGRFAGQYAKPRSSNDETRNGITLAAYRGDIVNSPQFDEVARRPDPERMLEGYNRAALTLNYIRALGRGGFADLHHPEYWDLGFIGQAKLSSEYRYIVDSVERALRFMENVLGIQVDTLQSVDLYTSHEALLLPYEQAQTRLSNGHWYNLSTHFPWVGARTLELDGAHIEYLRGIANPIGIKVSAAVDPAELLRVLEVVDPSRDLGRITLIHRFGAGKISSSLPKLIQAVRGAGRNPLWCCDPMHGNTRTTADGIKTRLFSDILHELEQAFDIHRAEGSCLGGVHFEMSGENVTECLGGASGITESDLLRAYKSEVDPRLNYEQALEMAMIVAHKLSR